MALNGKAARIIAWPDGKCAAHVGPFKSGGPYTLTVKGMSSVTLKDIPIAHADHPNTRLFTAARAAGDTCWGILDHRDAADRGLLRLGGQPAPPFRTGK